MIIRKDGYALDVDIEATRRYSQEHSLCECDEDRNLYAQIRERFPKLTAFLAELGLLIDRPDETGSCAVDDYIDYHLLPTPSLATYWNLISMKSICLMVDCFSTSLLTIGIFPMIKKQMGILQ